MSDLEDTQVIPTLIFDEDLKEPESLEDREDREFWARHRWTKLQEVTLREEVLSSLELPLYLEPAPVEWPDYSYPFTIYHIVSALTGGIVTGVILTLLSA